MVQKPHKTPFQLRKQRNAQEIKKPHLNYRSLPTSGDRKNLSFTSY